MAEVYVEEAAKGIIIAAEEQREKVAIEAMRNPLMLADFARKVPGQRVKGQPTLISFFAGDEGRTAATNLAAANF